MSGDLRVRARVPAHGNRVQEEASQEQWTLPSHATMFTGRPMHELSVGWLHPLDAALLIGSFRILTPDFGCSRLDPGQTCPESLQNRFHGVDAGPIRQLARVITLVE